ncbi:hypothetical protein [Spirillospora sp. NPDC047279]|uniref:hypothetical protein n=1 Tax=Spirillospora sp. NPDC047279 TaxID=3155478 RepID=UPI0033E057CF
MRDDRGERLRLMQQARAELMNQIARLQKQAEAFEDSAQRSAHLDERLAAMAFREQIRSDLGELTMHGNGHIAAINFHARTLREINPDEIGKRVLDAVRQAQLQISTERSARRAEIFRQLF